MFDFFRKKMRKMVQPFFMGLKEDVVETQSIIVDKKV